MEFALLILNADLFAPFFLDYAIEPIKIWSPHDGFFGNLRFPNLKLEGLMSAIFNGFMCVCVRTHIYIYI